MLNKSEGDTLSLGTLIDGECVTDNGALMVLAKLNESVVVSVWRVGVATAVAETPGLRDRLNRGVGVAVEDFDVAGVFVPLGVSVRVTSHTLPSYPARQ